MARPEPPDSSPAQQGDHLPRTPPEGHASPSPRSAHTLRKPPAVVPARTSAVLAPSATPPLMQPCGAPRAAASSPKGGAGPHPRTQVTCGPRPRLGASTATSRDPPKARGPGSPCSGGLLRPRSRCADGPPGADPTSSAHTRGTAYDTQAPRRRRRRLPAPPAGRSLRCTSSSRTTPSARGSATGRKGNAMSSTDLLGGGGHRRRGRCTSSPRACAIQSTGRPTPPRARRGPVISPA